MSLSSIITMFIRNIYVLEWWSEWPFMKYVIKYYYYVTVVLIITNIYIVTRIYKNKRYVKFRFASICSYYDDITVFTIHIQQFNSIISLSSRSKHSYYSTPMYVGDGGRLILRLFQCYHKYLTLQIITLKQICKNTNRCFEVSL